MRLLHAIVLASGVYGFNAGRPAAEVMAEGNVFTERGDFATSSNRNTSASRFLNEKSKQFAVDGKNIPDVPFDVGESYAGLLPISDSPKEERQLYYWFFPSEAKQAKDEIVIWLNGGPGCSSLAGLLTENGPFLWQSGTKAPVKNPYSWARLTNMVWIEQPVGTGYTTGSPNITNEAELAEEFKGFWKNFVKTFGLKNHKVYITGESYAGLYVPYIANAFLKANDTANFNLKGIAINDPLIAGYGQNDPVVAPFARYWSNILNFDTAFLDQLQKGDDACGATDYTNKYLTFPPPKAPFEQRPKGCKSGSEFDDAAAKANPCFNPYHISQMCPYPYSQLGKVNSQDYVPTGAQIYFNRTDVKKAIHAPSRSNWMQCGGPVFVNGGDTTVGPALDGTLTNVIDKTKNVLVGSGDLDYVVISNGTLLALQGTVWGGRNGFQSRPDTPFFVPDDNNTFQGAQGAHGNIGIWREERGLTWYTVRLAGHELPGYSLAGGYRVLQRLLGRIEDFSSTEPLF